MPNSMPTSVLWYGADRPPTESLLLRAGPLTALFEPDLGFLRYIRLGEREVLRGIYVAVRDRDWGTVQPDVSHLRLTRDDDSFLLEFDVTCREGAIDFAWHGSIAGTARGTIVFSMRGAASSRFLRNRIGFCVLHPIDECSGHACRIEHVDGRVEASRFPTLISPHQPFKDMRAISHEVIAGVWAEVRFTGDTFEMEDQRNWSDASFKTYCTPLGLPFPVEITKGTKVEQTVELSLTGELKGTRTAPRDDSRTIFRMTPGPSSPLPNIGLQVAGHGQPLSETEVARLQELNLRHLRVDIPLYEPTWPATLELAADQARALRVGLEAALFLGPSPGDELAVLAEELRKVGPPLARWLIFRVGEAVPDTRWIRLARRHLAAYDGDIPIGSGSPGNFTELNRGRPRIEPLDFVCYSANPQVHAFDNRSLVETLPMYENQVETARSFVGSLPISVTPLTLRPSTSPATPRRGEGGVTGGDLPPSVDLRQMSLFAGGWTVGAIKHISQARISSVTCFETTGWHGVMETEAGSRAPNLFRSIPGAVFPIYHVLADVGEWASPEVVPSASSDSLAVEGIVILGEGRRRAILANLTFEYRSVRIEGWHTPARLRVLDESNAERAMRAPEAFRAQVGDPIRPSGAAIELTLGPYAIARVDEWTGGA